MKAIQLFFLSVIVLTGSVLVGMTDGQILKYKITSLCKSKVTAENELVSSMHLTNQQRVELEEIIQRCDVEIEIAENALKALDSETNSDGSADSFDNVIQKGFSTDSQHSGKSSPHVSDNGTIQIQGFQSIEESQEPLDQDNVDNQSLGDDDSLLSAQEIDDNVYDESTSVTPVNCSQDGADNPTLVMVPEYTPMQQQPLSTTFAAGPYVYGLTLSAGVILIASIVYAYYEQSNDGQHHDDASNDEWDDQA